MLDDGARIHVISHLIRETINCGKSMLATSIMDRDGLSDSSCNSKEGTSIRNLIQKDRLLSAVSTKITLSHFLNIIGCTSNGNMFAISCMR